MQRTFYSLALTLSLAVSSPGYAQDLKKRDTLQEQHGVTAVALSADGKSLAFADKDNQLLIRPIGGTRRYEVGKHSAGIVSLAFSADGKHIASLSKDHLVQIWTSLKGDLVAKHKVDAANGLLAFSPEGKLWLAHVVGGKEGRNNWAEVRLLELASGTQRVLARTATPFDIPGIGANYSLRAFSPDGKFLAIGSSGVGGEDNSFILGLGDGKSPKLPAGLGLHAQLALGSDGKILISADTTTVKCWDLASGKLRASTKAADLRIAVSSNGLTLVTVSPQNLVAAYDIPADARIANPDRIRGMKAALADIEKGLLKVKSVPPPASPWYGDYLDLLKKECGIEIVHIDTSKTKLDAEFHGYNAMMMLEIEHQFGQGILDKLNKKAAENYSNAKKSK